MVVIGVQPTHVQTAKSALPPTNDAATYKSGLYVPKRITPKSAREYVRQASKIAGYTNREWNCLDEIIYRESRWHYKADNPTSSAFGLFQQLLLDPKTGLRKQTIRGLRYIEHRYDGDPCQALAHHNDKGWY